VDEREENYLTEKEKVNIVREEETMGPGDWVWFILIGLLLPILFFVAFGLPGLIAGLLFFGLYLFLVYVGTLSDQEKDKMEEKAEKIETAVQSRVEIFSTRGQDQPKASQAMSLSSLPGFRTMTPWKMITATFFYILVIVLAIGAITRGFFFIGFVVILAVVILFFSIQDEVY